MKLLYMQEYFERHLYVIEHDGKFLQVYRSSGLSRTGHGGMLIPFSGIDEGKGFRSHPGFIYKEMFYDGRWINHRKNIHYYDNVPENMDIIEDFLGDITPTQTVQLESFFNEDGTAYKDYKGYVDYVVMTQTCLDEARGNLLPFDLRNLIQKETK